MLVFSLPGRPVFAPGRLTRVFIWNELYFNLNAAARDAYDDGDLHIYYYNESDRTWEACEFERLVRTKNRPHGRLSCAVQDFGIYGLAIDD